MKPTQNLAALMLINGVAAGIVKPAIANETEPTAFSHGGVTYTVTEPMYVTVTNCPTEVTLTQNPKSPEAPVVPTAPEKPVPPPPPPQVTAPKPGPPPTGPLPPLVPPTGTAVSAVPSAAANKANGNLGALLVAGVAALAI